VGPDHIVARLKAIREPRMRALALIEALQTGEPDAWIEAIATIVSRSHTTDDADTMLAVQTITHAAADTSLPYNTRKQLYVAAIDRALPAIARLFLTESPNATIPTQLEKQLGAERPLKPTGRPLSLGERKALARTHDREQIMLLLRDPHPAVVAILVDNPHVTESDILKIASRRPSVPESLSNLAVHPRWGVRHAIKRALVMNPSTPLADAIRIVTTLRAAELAELAEDPALPEALREHAAQVRAASLRHPRA
jgi:hypothetical protein